MVCARWRVLPPLGGLLLAVSAALAGPALAADPISLRVEVYGFAGIHVLTLRSRIQEAGTRYAITTDYATSGIAGLMVDLTTHVQVEGRLGSASAQPERFRKDTRRNGVEHHDRIDYHPDGSVEGGATPPPPNPVPAAAARGTVDNLTAYFLLERQLARTGSCVLAVPIFDGAYRYDLVFSDAGPNVPPPQDAQRFGGTTIACRMKRRFPPGFPEPDQDEGAQQGTIWYARLLPGEAMVPVQMRLDTQLGIVEGFLAELHGRGVDLKFME
jgi:hypothetical protein